MRASNTGLMVRGGSVLTRRVVPPVFLRFGGVRVNYANRNTRAEDPKTFFETAKLEQKRNNA